MSILKFCIKRLKIYTYRLNRKQIGFLKTSKASEMLSKVLFQRQFPMSNLFDQRKPLTKAIIQLCQALLLKDASDEPV